MAAVESFGSQVVRRRAKRWRTALRRRGGEDDGDGGAWWSSRRDDGRGQVNVGGQVPAVARVRQAGHTC